MEISPKQKQLTYWSAQFNQQLLIIIFMNEVPVINFNFQTLNPKAEMPADGEITLLFEGKVNIIKWVIYPDQQWSTFTLDMMVFNPENPPAVILGTNGRQLGQGYSDIRRKIPVILTPKDAENMAKEVGLWIFELIGKIKPTPEP
jgi:hypothetical protein